MSKLYYVESLGCPRNEVDSELFAGITEQTGYVHTEDPNKADLIIINTCGFIKEAKEESIDTILELSIAKERNPDCKIVVTGCLVKRYQEALEAQLPEIDAFIPLKDFAQYAKWLSLNDYQFNRKALNKLPYSYLRISDGCNNNCTYCAIPSIRGVLQSEPEEKLIKEVKYLAAQGVQELIITAMDVTQYGVDCKDPQALLNLLSKIVKIDGFSWIRLLYLHPAHIKTELLQFVKNNPRIVPYFDVPIQHINDEVLKRMNRHTTRKDIERVIDEIRTVIPEAALRTTLITGFPGETEEQHKELLSFVKQAKFDRLGVFTYSKEEDTPAYDLKPIVNHNTAKRRKRELMEQHELNSELLLQKFLNKNLEIIIDNIDEEIDFQIEGRTKYDAPDIDGLVLVKTDTPDKYKVGDIVTINVIDTLQHDLIGKLVD
ncbi:MAG: 30S ribosomal protein S12 methylthiotransferase RimO [Candidatus Cloacimonadia bacterium]